MTHRVVDRRTLLRTGGSAIVGAGLGAHVAGTAEAAASVPPGPPSALSSAARTVEPRSPVHVDEALDDSEAIQRAIDDAAAAGGGVVALRSGVYTVGRQLLLRSGVHLRGEGSSTVLRSTIGPTDDAVMKMDTVTDASVSDLRLDGIAQETKGIWIVDSARTMVARCRLVATESPGVNMALVKIDFRSDGCWIIDNHFETPHLAILLQERSAGRIADTIIRGNQIVVTGPNFPGQGTGSEAIKIDKHCVGTVVAENVVRGSSLSCVTLEEGCRDTLVSGNFFYPADQSGIRVEDGQTDTPMRGVAITNNTIVGGTTGVYFGQESAARDVLVSGNRCSGQSGRAMLVWGTDATVQGNRCAGSVLVRGARMAVIGNEIAGGDLETITLRDSEVASNVVRTGRIVLNRAEDVSVAGNVVRGTPREAVAGLVVSGDAPSPARVRIAGNVFESGAGRAPWGIFVEGRARDVVLSGNIAMGAEGAVFVDPQARDVVNGDATAAWEVSGAPTTRTLDAGDVSTDELAGVVATLIGDLRDKGILGPP